MRYFDDPSCGVRAIEEDGTQDFLIGDDWIELGDEEVRAHLSEELTPEQMQRKTNAEARAYLASTDWYVIREQETGQEIPEAVLQQRANAREMVVE